MNSDTVLFDDNTGNVRQTNITKKVRRDFLRSQYGVVSKSANFYETVKDREMAKHGFSIERSFTKTHNMLSEANVNLSDITITSEGIMVGKKYKIDKIYGYDIVREDRYGPSSIITMAIFCNNGEIIISSFSKAKEYEVITALISLCVQGKYEGRDISGTWPLLPQQVDNGNFSYEVKMEDIYVGDIMNYHISFDSTSKIAILSIDKYGTVILNNLKGVWLDIPNQIILHYTEESFAFYIRLKASKNTDVTPIRNDIFSNLASTLVQYPW